MINLIMFIVIIFITLTTRFIYGMLNNSLSCYFGHSFEQTSHSSTGASYCVREKCVKCGKTRVDSDSMFG